MSVLTQSEPKLKRLHYPGPVFTNAHINRTRAIDLFKAGYTPEEIAAEFPRVWECSEGQLGQIYDSVYSDGRKETRYTITQAAVDKLLKRKARKSK